MLCVDFLPHNCLCTYIYFLEKKQRQKQQGLYQLKTREPKFLFQLLFIIYDYYILFLFFFICSPNFLNFSITQTRPR